METLVHNLEDMICPMCKDVYTSPRFLKGCYHSFCLKCIENATQSNVVTCPICQRKTTLPRRKADNLPTNFYLKDETLDKARKLMHRKCMQHEGQALDRMCLTCNLAACKDCMDHEGHSVHVLYELQENMEGQVRQLEESLTSVRREHCNLQAKSSSLSRFLRHQRGLLNRAVENQYYDTKEALESQTEMDLEELNDEIACLQEQVNKNKAILEQARNVWVKKSGKSNAVDMAKQVKCRLEEGEEAFARITREKVQYPSLVCHTQDVDRTLRRFLGQPLEHTPPEEPVPTPAAAESAVVPVQIRPPREINEILGVAPSLDNKRVLIIFRGNVRLTHSSIAEVRVEDGAVLISKYDFTGKTVGLYEWVKPSVTYCTLLQLSPKFGVLQISKAHPRMCLLRDQLGITRLHYVKRVLRTKEEMPRMTRWQINSREASAGAEVMRLEVFDPFNMDVTSDGAYCVVIDKGDDLDRDSVMPYKKIRLSDGMVKTEYMVPEDSDSDEDIAQPTQGAVVKLFRKDEDKPVDIYRPTKSTFVPSDVCFCRWKKRQLLIADWQNDEIHVVHVGRRGFLFKRLLAERHGEVVKPSALNTDTKRRVWIGCSSGTLLRLSMEQEGNAPVKSNKQKT